VLLNYFIQLSISHLIQKYHHYFLKCYFDKSTEQQHSLCEKSISKSKKKSVSHFLALFNIWLIREMALKHCWRNYSKRNHLYIQQSQLILSKNTHIGVIIAHIQLSLHTHIIQKMTLWIVIIIPQPPVQHWGFIQLQLLPVYKITKYHRKIN